jgi:hypothetical protein
VCGDSTLEVGSAEEVETILGARGSLYKKNFQLRRGVAKRLRPS